ncbi:hypothetical protein B9T31_03325 [Acinetobacter sp. ANC 4558]|uniref:DUF4377 domain-containing protein n=1 Tax=Acinetobacter sp. ANC 4558 TaxID=1977876 RepID=UPI000A332858|nr:DUF4377 domain-containing protein [Acinetobacter sp. ANC 4558]OTG87545.1 hypothetical protein B9T31_03325 [Acinetobacter sp. ANC 4558]
MKLKLIAYALFPLTLAACQTTDLTNKNSTSSAQMNKILSSYLWSTVTDPTLKPIVLHFNAQNHLGISTSCNTLGSSWKIVNQTLELGTGFSTSMACNAAATQQENFTSALFNNKNLPFTLNINNPEQPTLTLTSPQGTRVVFTGKMTPETKYQTQAETIFLEISSELKPCIGVAPQSCLLVREVKYDEKGIKTHVDKDWTLFYSPIENFEHRKDEQSIIRVKRYELKNPPADHSKYVYIHDMTVETQEIKPSK